MNWQRGGSNRVDYAVFEYIPMQIGIDVAKISPLENGLLWTADYGTVTLKDVQHFLLDRPIFGEDSQVARTIVRTAVLFVETDAGTDNRHSDQYTGRSNGQYD